MMRRFALGLTCLAAVSGCGSPRSATVTASASARNTPGESSQAIIGGTNDTGDPAVIALYARKPGATLGALCSAEVIAPDTLLTAGHCCDPAEVGEGVVYMAYLGPDLTDKSHPELWVPVKSRHKNPQFSSTNILNGYDICVVNLEAPLPASITPLPYNTQPLTSADANQSIRIIGYGLSDGSAQTGAGIKRQATTIIDSVSDNLITLGDAQHNICNGDSGGPALMSINGVETIVGITSFGFIDCIGQGNDTRVDLYTSFIQQWIGGGSCIPDCSGKGCGDDGCGGDCGICAAGQACTGNQCSTCTPSCASGSCGGGDGCGGLCECEAGQLCIAGFCL